MPKDKSPYYYSSHIGLSKLEKEKLEEAIKMLEDMYLESRGKE